MQTAIIEKLVETLGYPILEIQDNVYIVSEFIPADNQTQKHLLKGKNITEIINNFATASVFNKDVILAKQDSIPVLTKIFHKDILFTLTK